MKHAFVIVLAAAMAAGCAETGVDEQQLVEVDVDESMVEADRFVIMSLNPSWPKSREPSAGTLYGYEVLGESAVADRAVRRELLTELAQGVADHDGAVAGCFNPRHGIRIDTGPDVIEYVICFECLSYERYFNGAEAGSQNTSHSPAAAFNRIYRAAGLTIAE